MSEGLSKDLIDAKEFLNGTEPALVTPLRKKHLYTGSFGSNAPVEYLPPTLMHYAVNATQYICCYQTRRPLPTFSVVTAQSTLQGLQGRY